MVLQYVLHPLALHLRWPSSILGAGYRHDKIIVLTPRRSGAAQLGDT